MTTTTTARRSVGRIVVAMLFVALAVNAGNEALEMLSGDSDGPTALLVLQSLCGATAAATAWGAWRGTRWSPALAVLYGLIAGGMVVSLGPMLDMPVEERGGLWIGGGIILTFALACAWYLRRVSRAAVEPPVHPETRRN
jgi:hypothetical protein